MAENEKVTLTTATEQQLISKIFLDIVNNCPDIPSGLMVQYGNLEDSESMCIIPNGKAIYTKQWISGSYEAQFPASLIYRVRPADTLKRLEAQKVIDQIGEYLENMSYPQIDGNRTIQKIERLSNSELVYRDESGIEDWQLNLNLIYKYKKGK